MSTDDNNNDGYGCVSLPLLCLPIGPLSPLAELQFLVLGVVDDEEGGGAIVVVSETDDRGVLLQLHLHREPAQLRHKEHGENHLPSFSEFVSR